MTMRSASNLVTLTTLLTFLPTVRSADIGDPLAVPGPVVLAAFSADGRQLLTAGKKGVHVCQLDGGKSVHWSLERTDVVEAAFASRSGRLAYWRDDAIIVCDPQSGAEYRLKGELVEDATVQLPGRRPFGLAISADGDCVVSASWAGPLLLWDGSTRTRRFQFHNHKGRALALAVSPDGRLVASAAEDRTLRIWEAATGYERVRYTDVGRIWALTFTPDGRGIASEEQWTATVRFFPESRKPLRFLNTADSVPLAFTADGKLVAVALSDRRCVLAEATTGAELKRWDGLPGDIRCLGFAPDGRKLVIGLNTETEAIRLLDISMHHQAARSAERPASTPLAPANVDTCWSDLAGEDGAAALLAIDALSAAPGQAVPLLKARLVKEPMLSAERLARLVADLDSARFQEREKASAELERFGKLAEPALRDVLKGEPPLELRRRVEQILARTERRVLPPEEVRTLRAIEVLERISTREARDLLREIAEAGKGTLRGRDARAALDRLETRAK
jgi:WD40 repeat protein